MRIIECRKLDEKVELPMGTPFVVKSLGDETEMVWKPGPTKEVRTHLQIDLPDECWLRIRAEVTETYVLSWRISKEGELLILVWTMKQELYGEEFTVWVDEMREKPVRFVEMKDGQARMVGGEENV